jgi:hypothetical protein
MEDVFDAILEFREKLNGHFVRLDVRVLAWNAEREYKISLLFMHLFLDEFIKMQS